jgi:Nuclease-related domain
VVLHDRAIPHRRANIDHIAVVASGVWVIDTKHYRGRLERRELGGWFVPRPRLFVAGRDQTQRVTAARRLQALVSEALVAEQPGAGPLVRAALYFTGVDVGLFTRPFTLEGVLVTWSHTFGRVLAASGPLGPGERNEVACRLSRLFPPYATSAHGGDRS